MRIVLDATALTCWNRCREEFRLTYLENRAPAAVAIHREFGIALHQGVEALWCGYGFTPALAIVMAKLRDIKEDRIPTADKRKWEELKAMAPTMLAQYHDSVDISQDKLQHVYPKADADVMLEHEWSWFSPFGIDGVTLMGRIDRVEVGPKLIDIKTATEMDGTDEYGKKVGWEKAYRAQMAKDLGLALYDWYLRSVGLSPVGINFEVILKPSERYGKKCRIVQLEMPEVIAYRERFDQLLEFSIREIKHYVSSYAKMQPWPMNGSACSGKFGNCAFMAICGLGLNPRTERLYREREEHLSIKGRRIEL